MLRFLGGLIAFSLLSMQPLTLNLAPLIWKMLIHEDIDHRDLENIDHTFYHSFKDALKGSPDILETLN